MFSLERKYQKPYDYIDKGPKQEMRIKEIHICFPEKKKELEAGNKIPGRLSLTGNVQISHGNHTFSNTTEKTGIVSRVDGAILFFHYQIEKSSILHTKNPHKLLRPPTKHEHISEASSPRLLPNCP